MRAAVFKGKGVIEVEDVTLEKPLNKDVKIKVKACGICGTDQHIYHGYPGSAEVIPPRILGHELSGEVVEVGENVTTVAVGDRISIDPNIYCGECSFCRNGKAHLCDNMQAIGVTRDGGMGEYAIAPSKNCYVVPDDMSDDEAAMIEPLGCVLHGFKKLNVKPTDTVLLVGGGFIGQLFLQLVRNQSVAEIIVSEPVASKHELLYQLGADSVINPIETSIQAELGDGADVVIECVGRKETMEAAVQSARKGAQVLLFGVSSPEERISVSPFEVFSKELMITGSFINPYTHQEAISLVQQKKVSVASIISHRFTLDEIPEVMKNYGELRISKGIINY